MNADWPMTDRVKPHWAGRVGKKPGVPWSREDRELLAELWNRRPKLAAPRIAEIMERPTQSIYQKAHQMGLPPRIKRSTRSAFVRKPKTKHGGTQRRFMGVENSTGPKITLEPHDPRARAGSTVFPTTVIPASRLPRLLKSGKNSRKIGAIWEKGRWKGMPVYTLTLEERATCPRTCREWLTCYGNNMHFAQRIFDDGTLTKRLWGELATLAAEYPAGFLLRLHVLGDFFSLEYVDFWRSALQDFPQLHIFGFTARKPPDPIGISLVELVATNYERFRIRFSGAGYETDCSEVVDRAEDATGVLCPAESDPKRCCANCGLCMQSNRTISFVRH